MTKTPAIPATCPGMGDIHHDNPEEPVEQLPGRLPVPELVVTCEPCVTQCDQSPHGPTTGPHHPDEESICSDSGLSGSPASSLELRKLSNASSAGLSPASSFEECDEDLMGYGECNRRTLSQDGGLFPGEPVTVRMKSTSVVHFYIIVWIVCTDFAH